jgi:hypothetical protein
MGCVRIVDQSGACHDEASLWSVCFRSGDQVFYAIEISPPDIILILSHCLATVTPVNFRSRAKSLDFALSSVMTRSHFSTAQSR